MRFCAIHLRAISLKLLMISINEVYLRIEHLKSHREQWVNSTFDGKQWLQLINKLLCVITGLTNDGMVFSRYSLLAIQYLIARLGKHCPLAPINSVAIGCSCCMWPVMVQHDDVIKWKHFLRYWPFVQGIHRSWWIPRTKASDAELWFFFFIYAWIIDWVNNRETGDLRCHRGHYDVIVMKNHSEIS